MCPVAQLQRRGAIALAGSEKWKIRKFAICDTARLKLCFLSSLIQLCSQFKKKNKKIKVLAFPGKSLATRNPNFLQKNKKFLEYKLHIFKYLFEKS